MNVADFRTIWNEACLSAGLKSISTDSAARIMAIVYVHGNNEAFCLNQKFLADVDYIRKEYHIEGSAIPDPEFSRLLKMYAEELEDYYEKHKHEKEGNALFNDPKPQWAIDLFKERYDIKLIN